MTGRAFAERNQRMVGIVAVVVVLNLIVVALNFNTLASFLGGGHYRAEFHEAAGLSKGADVEISGVAVGEVRDVEIEGDHVRVTFTVDRELGDKATAAIKSATVLGTKVLSVRSAGHGSLQRNATIPLARTTSPYDLTTALADLTTTSGQIDTATLSKALDSVSAAFSQTPDELKTILSGTRQLAEAVNTRDGQLASLLRNANRVTGVLAERNSDVISIISDANAVLAALEKRGDVIARLISAIRAVTMEVSGFIEDNEDQVGPALAELRRTLQVLNRHAADIRGTLKYFAQFTQSLFDALGNGPFFYAYLGGMAPVNMTPIIDDLFKDPDGGEGQ